jgi:hypothetical protein
MAYMMWDVTNSATVHVQVYRTNLPLIYKGRVPLELRNLRGQQ